MLYVHRASIPPAELHLSPSLGMLIEIKVANKTKLQIKWLSRETCLCTRAESYTRKPHGGGKSTNSHKLPSDPDTPPAAPTPTETNR